MEGKWAWQWWDLKAKFGCFSLFHILPLNLVGRLRGWQSWSAILMKRVVQHLILETFSVLQFQSQVKAISFMGQGELGRRRGLGVGGLRGQCGRSNGLEALNVRTFHLLLLLLQLPLDGNFWQALRFYSPVHIAAFSIILQSVPMSAVLRRVFHSERI